MPSTGPRRRRDCSRDVVHAVGGHHHRDTDSRPGRGACGALLTQEAVGSGCFQARIGPNFWVRSRNVMPITLTDGRDIAAAMVGESSNSKKGYTIPAAMGIPEEL